MVALPYISAPSRSEVQKEYGAWLASVFGSSEELTLGTFTFRNPDSGSSPTRTGIGRQYVMNAGRKLADYLMDNGSSVFVAVEEGTDTRRLHLHSLSNCDQRRNQIVRKWWERKYGFTNLKRVSSKKGVSLYVTKYVTKGDLPFFAGGPLFTPVKEQAVDTDLRLDSSSAPG